jgi:hypothetical protein
MNEAVFHRKVVPLNRITVVETLYHKSGDNQPKGHEHRFTRQLESDEQAYERTCRVGEDWTLIDAGWLNGAQIGMLILVNDEGKFPQTIPTAAEVAEASEKVLELGTTECFAIVPPGESLRFVPYDITNLRVRSAHGTIKYTLKFYPA